MRCGNERLALARAGQDARGVIVNVDGENTHTNWRARCRHVLTPRVGLSLSRPILFVGAAAGPAPSHMLLHTLLPGRLLPPWRRVEP